MTKEEAKQIVEEAEQTLNANYEFASKRLELSEKYGCISLEVQQFEKENPCPYGRKIDTSKIKEALKALNQNKLFE